MAFMTLESEVAKVATLEYSIDDIGEVDGTNQLTSGEERNDEPKVMVGVKACEVAVEGGCVARRCGPRTMKLSASTSGSRECMEVSGFNGANGDHARCAA